MILKPAINEVMERTKKFCSSKKKGMALIHINAVESIKTPGVRPLNQWKFPEDLEPYLDACVENFVYYWTHRISIDDDLIPSMYPSFGIAEHSAFIGGEVSFSSHTSWHHPIIQTWSDMDKLELREDNSWLRMVIDGMEYLKKISEDRYALKLRGAEAPMDIANALRGNDLFTDFYDEPENVHKLMEFCTEAAEWMLSHQKAVVGEFYGGTLTGGDVWLPGNSIGHLSEDAAALCAPNIYDTFGVPYTSRLCSRYDNTYMHTHALGEHTLPSICSIPGINFIEITNDPNCSRAIEVLKRNIGILQDKIIHIELTKEEIHSNMETLKQLKTIIKYKAADLDDAAGIIATIRSELRV